MRRRFAAVFVVCLAAYAATIGMDSFGRSEYGGDEPHYLLTARSILDDRSVDLLDEYRGRAYDDFYPYDLDPHGQLTDGRLNEPHGVGFPLLIAPALALGGPKAVELLLAAIAALAVALGYLLALRVAPDPWALGGSLAVGLSPPFVAYGSAVYPELAAGAALAGAALLALRMTGERPRARTAFACFALLGTLPWLGTKFVPAGLLIGWFAVRELRRARRGLLALGGVELSLFSVAFYVGLNEALYGGPTPYAADVPGETATDAAFPLGYLDRAYRLVALLIDREYGLLRWAPVFLLIFVGGLHAWRAHRERLAEMLPALRGAERTAGLCGAVLGAHYLMAAFLPPTMFGFWFPGRHLMAGLLLAVPLVALGLRHAPRAGTALALLGVVATGWVYTDVRWDGGGFVGPLPPAPWGPLERLFPFFGDSVYPYALAGALAVAALVLCLREWRHSRTSAGATFAA